jgi:hypothetical protein
MPPVKFEEVAMPAQFSLRVPDHWARFDLSDAPLARARREALKTVRDPVSRMRVEDMFRQAKALNQAARRHGALWAAGTATMYDDALFVGNVMVFAVAAGEGGGGVDGPDVIRQLSRSSTESAEAARVVSTVELPHVGEAVRAVGTETVSVNSGTKVEMLTMNTFIPVPPGAGRFMLVTCCSPNLPLAEEVYELFDAITSTFHW